MKFRGVLIILVTVLFISDSGYSQMRGKGRSDSQKSTGLRSHFDLDSRIFIVGKTVDIWTRTIPGCRVECIGITLDDSKEHYNVILSPEDFLKSGKIVLENGSIVKITAFKGNASNRTVYYGATISVDGKYLVLRDSKGDPRWMNSGKRSDNGSGNGRGRGKRRGRR